MTKRQVIIIPKVGGGYVASVPSLPGVQVEADDLDVLDMSIHMAANAWVKAAKEHGGKIPDEVGPITLNSLKTDDVEGVTPGMYMPCLVINFNFEYRSKEMFGTKSFEEAVEIAKQQYGMAVIVSGTTDDYVHGRPLAIYYAGKLITKESGE